ncbi:MAG: hypothetical protein JRF33_07245 [Deltaproteobacteria bacterium]|nr:hypothetical protein [Deltaproteobacteria bacterium]
MSMKSRSKERAKRIVAHTSRGFDEARLWDLQYWQSKTPEERLSALVAIRRDVEKVQQARAKKGS